MNRVVLVGRLTRDPELRYTPAGVAVANGTIAVNRPFKNKETGENEADFINFVTWRKQAENLANYMKKGNLIGIDGRIQTRSYDAQDGKRVFVTEVLAESIQFLESRNQQANNGGYNAPTTSTQQQRINVANENVQKNAEPFPSDGQQIDINDDDLPF